MMKNFYLRFKTLILLIGFILVIFIGRTLLAAQFDVPRLFELFDSFTILASLFVILKGFHHLCNKDWIIALAFGIFIGVSMLFTTLYSPYPFFGIVKTHSGQAIIRGLFTTIATLCGLIIMRQSGPVTFLHSEGKKNPWKNILIGLAVGIPFAILNVFAFTLTEGQKIVWQNPLAAFVDALQPGIVEEIIYRFALWGLLWLILRKSLPTKASTFAGLLVVFVHTYAHYDALFIQAPLMGIGMGLVLGIVWGLPLYFLARHRGLESAIAFHWIQDALRFLTGF
jgi:hypothetical protein